MDISEIKKPIKKVFLSGVIVEKNEPRIFSRMGDPGKLAVAVLKDKTGRIDLILWDGDVDLVEEGDEVVLENCFVKEYNGSLQVTTGRNGSIRKV